MSSILKVDTIQNTGGTTGLTIDSSGRTITPTKPSFLAYDGSTGWQTLGSTSNTKLPLDTTQHNRGSHYDTSNYRFVCPCDGVYSLQGQAYHDANTEFQLRIILNGSTDISFVSNSTQGDSVATSITRQFTANDYVELWGKISNSDASDYYAGNTSADHSYLFFSGYLIG